MSWCSLRVLRYLFSSSTLSLCVLTPSRFNRSSNCKSRTHQQTTFANASMSLLTLFLLLSSYFLSASVLCLCADTALPSSSSLPSLLRSTLVSRSESSPLSSSASARWRAVRDVASSSAAGLDEEEASVVLLVGLDFFFFFFFLSMGVPPLSLSAPPLTVVYSELGMVPVGRAVELRVLMEGKS